MYDSTLVGCLASSLSTTGAFNKLSVRPHFLRPVTEITAHLAASVPSPSPQALSHCNSTPLRFPAGVSILWGRCGPLNLFLNSYALNFVALVLHASRDAIKREAKLLLSVKWFFSVAGCWYMATEQKDLLLSSSCSGCIGRGKAARADTPNKPWTRDSSASHLHNNEFPSYPYSHNATGL